MTNQMNRTTQTPAYFQSFECIGSKCPDTCCAGWQVDIDKANYKKLRNLSNPKWVEKVKTHFYVVSNPGQIGYARIKLDAGGNCPMLTAEKLCSVQQELGEGYLSNTCRNFPRQLTAIGQGSQMLASLSCPETARLCLADTTGWRLTDKDLNIPMGKPIPYVAGFTSKDNLSKNNLWRVRHFERLQSFALEVVQHRDMAMWQRLLLVGMTCERLDAINEGMGPARDEIDRQVEFLVLQARVGLLDGSFKQQTQDLMQNPSITLAQQSFIKRMNDERLLMNVDKSGSFTLNKAFMECVAETFFGIEYDTLDLAGSAKRLKAASERFAHFENVHPYMLENFVCNSLALLVFPYSSEVSLSEQWRQLMIRYAMVRFYLIGLSAMHEDNFSMAHCIKLVYSFSKEVQHNNKFLPRVTEFLKQENLYTLATMAILVH